jgi:hypothetical protein
MFQLHWKQNNASFFVELRWHTNPRLTEVLFEVPYNYEHDFYFLVWMVALMYRIKTAGSMRH